MPDSPEDGLHTGKGKGGEIGFRIASPPFFIADEHAMHLVHLNYITLTTGYFFLFPLTL